jgi:hypothetical protein
MKTKVRPEPFGARKITFDMMSLMARAVLVGTGTAVLSGALVATAVALLP